MMGNRRRLGVHISISGGIYKSFERAEDLKINAMQIFLKNSNRWEAKPYTPDVITKFKTDMKNYGDIDIFAHSGYLINLAGAGINLEKSISALKDELYRADQLDIAYLVVHPGNHLGTGEEAGKLKISDSIDRAYSESGINSVKILLETTAGQGSSIGSSFQHIADIIKLSKNSHMLGVCLDTCHIHAAGYDISTEPGVDKTISDFDKIISLDKLELIHLNDSKKEPGSRVDRHEHLGTGFIGKKGLKHLLNHKRISGVPVILETPKSDEASDRKNLDIVIELIENNVSF